MFLQRENHKKFEPEDMQVSISVDSGYVINKDWRTRIDLASIYNDLFPVGLVPADPMVESQDKTAKMLKGFSQRRAQEIWQKISDNPKSPPGPLTLAIISKAILEGANFNHPRDRHAFFIFLENNPDFQKFFRWAMLDRIASLGSKRITINELCKDFKELNLTIEEAGRLVDIWFPNTDGSIRTLHTKLANAASSKQSEFFKELFQFAPKAAKAYQAKSQMISAHFPGARIPDKVEPTINEAVLMYPGIVEAAVLGFEQSEGFLSHALALEEIQDLMTHLIVWKQVIVSGCLVSGRFDMSMLYSSHPLPADAFVSQLKSEYTLPAAWEGFNKLDPKTWHVLNQAEESNTVIPNNDEMNFMFEQMAKLVRNSMIYFLRHRRQEMIALVKKVANLNLLMADSKSERVHDAHHKNIELRYRLFHPVTIRAMEEFWLDNFDVFKAAAGNNDEFLCHLVGSMPNPALFLRRMLSMKFKNSRIGSPVERWEYLEPRIAKLLPVLGKASLANFEKDFKEISGKRIRKEDSTDFVSHRFRSRVGELIDNYAATPEDSGEELLSVFDDDHSRALCDFSSSQLTDCLKETREGDPKSVNSRLELIVAREDQLFSSVSVPEEFREEFQRLRSQGQAPAKDSPLGLFLATHYPTIWARISIEGLGGRKALREYVEKPVSMREAYVIASNQEFWRNIDPYSRHPFQSLAEWMLPGSKKEFFDEEKKALESKNLIFALRMEWGRGYHQTQSFEQFLVGKYKGSLGDALNRPSPAAGAEIFLSVNPGPDASSEASQNNFSDDTKKAFFELYADIARGADLFELHKGGRLAVPNNPSRAKAFLAQVNTPEKVESAYDFVLQIDSAHIDAEAIFHLMTKEESPTRQQKMAGKTCFELAKVLIQNNPAFLPEIIDLHRREADKISPQAMPRLVEWIMQALIREDIVTSAVIQKLMALGYLKDALAKNLVLFRRLIHQAEIFADLEEGVREVLANPENQICENLDGDDLLRLRDIFPKLFNNLVDGKDNSILRHRLKTRLKRALENNELDKIRISGLGVLFAKEPEFFCDFLLGIPAALLDPPEESIGTDNEDVFMLNTQAHAEAFLDAIRNRRFNTDQTANLVMRCFNSKNTQLIELIGFVLVEKLETLKVKQAGILLSAYLTHDDVSPAFICYLLSDGGSLRPSVVNVLLQLDFVEKYLEREPKTKTFSERALKLWSALFQNRLIVTYLNGIDRKSISEEQVACVNKLSRLSDEYRLFQHDSEKKARTAQVAANLSALFLDASGDDGSGLFAFGGPRKEF